MQFHQSGFYYFTKTTYLFTYIDMLIDFHEFVIHALCFVSKEEMIK